MSGRIHQTYNQASGHVRVSARRECSTGKAVARAAAAACAKQQRARTASGAAARVAAAVCAKRRSKAEQCKRQRWRGGDAGQRARERETRAQPRPGGSVCGCGSLCADEAIHQAYGQTLGHEAATQGSMRVSARRECSTGKAVA